MGYEAEKPVLPSSTPQPVEPKSGTRPAQRDAYKWRKPLAYLLISFFALRYCLVPILLPHHRIFHSSHHHHTNRPSGATCEQADPILPQGFNVSALIEGKESEIIEWLSGAVRVPTEIFDEMGPIGEDKRWDAFYGFSACKWSRL